MKTHKLIPALLFASSLNGLGCAVSNQDTSSAAIKGGDRVDANHTNLSYIASVEARTGGTVGVCSGVFVSASWVLTAAHCVQGYSKDQVTVLYGGRGAPDAIDAIDPYPSYRGNSAPASEQTPAYIGDLALLHLAEPAAPGGIVRVMPLETQVLAPGTNLDCYAYNPNDRQDLRKATFAITSLTTEDGTPGSLGVGYSTRGNSRGQEWESGDSGGPCFVPGSDPSLPGTLAGIHSSRSIVSGVDVFWQDTGLSNYYGWVRSQIANDVENMVVTYGANLGAVPGNATWSSWSSSPADSLGGLCTGRATCTGSTRSPVDPYPGLAKDVVVQWQCGAYETVYASYLPPSTADRTFTVSCPNPPVSGIQDVLATYGSSCAGTLGNQTNAVIAACGARSVCDYPIPSRIGNLAPGCSKSLDVSYRCGTGPVHQINILAAAGQTLHIDCRATRPLPTGGWHFPL